MWPELLLLASFASAAEVDTVVTLDNGEFNLPMFTPRHNGRWEQPSVAQEVVSGIARVRGANPRVYTYLPPGRTAGRPGAPVAITPHVGGCAGPSDSPDDPCWCPPADRCWSDLAPNYHPSASTSLYLTAAAVREELRGRGPRIEVHVSDLFEEDPSTATDPSHSDRCVTLDGTRKALRGLTRLPAGESLDHLAVGVLRARIDPPPPGGSWGSTYALRPAGDVCWSGVRGFPWESLREPVDFTMAVLVLGVDTADHRAEVDAFLDGLASQMGSGDLRLELVRLREPAVERDVEGMVPLADPLFWKVPPAPRPPRVACGDLTVDASLTVDGLPVPNTAAGADCAGAVTLQLPPDALRHAFLREAGLQQRPDRVELSGVVEVRGEPEALLDAASRLGEHAARGDRPLPLWGALVKAFDLDDPGARDPVWTPWTARLRVASLVITGVDTRPWALALLGALASAVAAASGVWMALVRSEAARSIRSHWERNVGPGADPLLQRPIATVLAEAQEELRLGRARRLAAALGVGVVVLGAAFWLLMQLHALQLERLAGITHG